jgi:hypothetical protein
VLRPDRDRALAELFVERVSAERLRAGAAIGVRAAEPGTLRTREARAVAAALEKSSLPPLEQVHRARTRGPDTDVLLWTDAGEPLLGLARAGEGLCAAWASEPLPGWAAAWAASPELLGPLLRALGRARAEGGAGPRATLEDGVLRVSGASGWPPRVEAVLRGPGRVGTTEVPLVLTLPAAAPGADPRDLRTAALAPGALAGLRGPRAELRAAGRALPVALPIPPEFRPEARSEAGLTSGLAEAGGPPPPEAGEPPAGHPGPHPAGPFVLALALGLLTLAGALGWEGRRAHLQAAARPGR